MSQLNKTDNSARVVDLQQALANMEGDVELLQEIVEVFLEVAPEQLDELTAGIEAGEVGSVGTLAHGMKGGAANIGADAFVAAAHELEQLARDGSLSGAQELLENLRDEFMTLRDVLEGVDWPQIAATQQV